MKEFLKKLGLTPKKAIIYSSILSALLLLFVAVQIIFNLGFLTYDGAGEPYYVDVGTDAEGNTLSVHLFQHYFNGNLQFVGRILFSAIFGITILAVFTVYLLRYLKNTGKIKSTKFALPLNIALTSILFVLFVAISAVSIMIMQGNFIITLPSPEPGGTVSEINVFQIVNEFFDPKLADYTGRPTIIDTNWSDWYYWIYWTLIPLMASLFAGFVLAGLFGVLFPVLRKKKEVSA